MKTKKLLSILLALMMMLSVVPFYASAVETLAVKNVSQWPTISYKTEDGTLVSDGCMYYGQKVSDILVINDDEIVLNAAGEQVPGHFEFIDPDEIPDSANDATRANIKFVPDDSNSYSGFQRKRSRDTTFKVVATTPVLVSDAPTATSVDSGSTLSSSVISGGQVMNPYNPEDTDALNATWYWTNPDEVIYESGEYEATLFIHAAYEVITEMVYVEVNSIVKGTTITEVPTAEVEFAQDLTYNDLILNGGQAVEYGTETEVPGTFSVKNPDGIFTGVGTYNIPVVFTPDDTESYTASEGTMSVTVTKGNYKFVNENGEEIVPEITLPYGTTFNTGEALGSAIKSVIKDFSNLTGVDAVGGTGSISIVGHDADEIAPVGTKTYTARIRPYNSDKSNYNVTDLQFVLTIEPVVFTTTASWGIEGVISGKLSHTVPGTFDIFVDGKLVGDNVGGGNEWSVDYPIPATGDYTIKVVYNPVENDNYSMVDFEKTVNAKMRRYITFGDGGRISKTVNGDERMPIMKLGDTIELSTLGGEKFLGWRITDANGNAVDLGIADLMASTITFTMPDYDLIVTAEYEKENTGDTDGGFDIDNIFGDLTEGDSDCWLVNFINNLIAKIKQIITTVTSLFRSIGDHT